MSEIAISEGEKVEALRADGSYQIATVNYETESGLYVTWEDGTSCEVPIGKIRKLPKPSVLATAFTPPPPLLVTSSTSSRSSVSTDERGRLHLTRRQSDTSTGDPTTPTTLDDAFPRSFSSITEPLKKEKKKRPTKAPPQPPNWPVPAPPSPHTPTPISPTSKTPKSPAPTWPLPKPPIPASKPPAPSLRPASPTLSLGSLSISTSSQTISSSSSAFASSTVFFPYSGSSSSSASSPTSGSTSGPATPISTTHTAHTPLATSHSLLTVSSSSPLSSSSSSSSSYSPSARTTSMSVDNSMNRNPRELAACFELYEEIGKGSYGKVYRAKDKRTNEEVAVKILDLKDAFDVEMEFPARAREQKFEETWREITQTALLQHPNIIRFRQTFVLDEEIWIILPLMGGGSVKDAILQSHRHGLKDNCLVATILLYVLQALAYIHSSGKIHKDVKADNVLLSATGEVGLADFGVTADACTWEEERNKEGKKTGGLVQKKCTAYAGSLCWMAPEVMGLEATLDGYKAGSEIGHDEKADVWSFGVLALELAYGDAPYADYDPITLRQTVVHAPSVKPDHYKDTSYKFDKSFEKLVERCLEKNPKKRPSAQELLNEHPFFKKFARTSEYVYEKLVKKVLERKLIERREKMREQKGKRRKARGDEKNQPRSQSEDSRALNRHRNSSASSSVYTPSDDELLDTPRNASRTHPRQEVRPESDGVVETPTLLRKVSSVT